MTLQTLSHDAYKVGWICPLNVELIAAIEMLDEQHGSLPQLPADQNIYKLGSINGHNVVIAGLHQPGNCPAATVAAQMTMTFPNVKFGLLVGIGGGVPVQTDDGMIRVGHVVVGKPTGIHSGVIQYDHGKAKGGQLERTGFLAPPPPVLLNAAQVLEVNRAGLDYDPIWKDTQRFQTDRPGLKRFKFPGWESDHLYQADYIHRKDGVSCEEGGCSLEHRIEREVSEGEQPFVTVHRGTIASGELVIKDAEHRDRLAQQYGILCFEMEAAGTLAGFPCMVIRGISDYCDSHKSDAWHGYAAAVAAAYARQLLFHLPREQSQSNASPFMPIRPRNSLPGHGSPSSVAGKVPRTHYFISFSRNKQFVGRSTTLETVETLFFTKGSQQVAIVGLGGVGKTQIALKFAYHVKETKPLYSVFWVPALSEASFKQAYVEIAKKLSIPRLNEDEDPRESVRRYLSSEAAGPWLLVVDNADDMEMLLGTSDNPGGLSEYFPESEDGLTLFTTRSREVAVDLAGRNVVELQEMNRKEAATLLETSLIQEDPISHEDMDELLDQLAYLPLAIVQSAAYLNKTQVSVSDYLRLLRSTEKDMVSLLSRAFRDGTRYTGSQNAVAATWLVSFEQIRRSDPAAANILTFLSCIEPKAIPQSILPRSESEEEMLHAISTLRGYAFLVKREGNMFDMHRLVHVATRVWVEGQKQTMDTAIGAVQHISVIFPTSELPNRSLWREYLPHALSALERSKTWEATEKYRLFMFAGRCLDVDRRFKEAIVMFEPVVAMIRENFEETIDGRLAAEHELARVYLQDGQHQQAITIFEHVVAMRKKTRPEDDYARLIAEYELASAYLQSRQIDKAIPMFEHVATTQKRTLPEDNEALLATQHALARAYSDNREFKKATAILEDIIPLYQSTLPADDYGRLGTEHELGRAYLCENRVKEAIPILERVAVMYRQMLAEDDIAVLSSEYVLARAYLEDNRPEGMVLLERVVAKQRRTLREDEPLRLSSELALAQAVKKEASGENTV